MGNGLRSDYRNFGKIACVGSAAAKEYVSKGSRNRKRASTAGSWAIQVSALISDPRLHRLHVVVIRLGATETR